MSNIPSLGDRFIAAFNEIEHHLRHTLNAEEHEPISEMARAYTAKRRSPREHREALLAFASLRNAISHGKYYNNRPIAEPLPEVVDQIEALRDQLCAPPKALTTLGQVDVCRVSPSDQVRLALKYVGEDGYSQIPVHDDDTYIGLLTTNAIARWLATHFDDNELAEPEPVAAVLRHAEDHEKARHFPRRGHCR